MQRNIDTVTKVFNVAPVPKPEEIYTTKFIPSDAERMLKF
jgi:hypothetical protein